MHHELLQDAEVEGWLKSLGVVSLRQWDVLVFLERHQTSLVGVDHLALLLGDATGPVVDALDVLESLGLVERSRVSLGARLYRFTPPSDPPRDESFLGLLALSSHRGGRLVVARHLRKGDQSSPKGFQGARRIPRNTEPAPPSARDVKRDRGEGMGPWLKVV